MEMRHRLSRWWFTFANAAGDFIEELVFRVVLAFDVLVGRVPRQVELRWWNRATETPVLVDVFDWTDERLIFSVLVWPPLESPQPRLGAPRGSPRDASYDHRERVRAVLEAITRGAAEEPGQCAMRWTTGFGGIPRGRYGWRAMGSLTTVRGSTPTPEEDRGSETTVVEDEGAA